MAESDSDRTADEGERPGAEEDELRAEEESAQAMDADVPQPDESSTEEGGGAA